MVFCYKIITESPPAQRRAFSRSVSPRRVPYSKSSSISQPLSAFTCDTDPRRSLLNDIPEREWRLLATMAKKREDEEVREDLANHFRKLWDFEKKERRMVTEETLNQYKRYLAEKREKDRICKELRMLQLNVDQEMKREFLIEDLMKKHIRSNALADWYQGRKTSFILDRAIEKQARLIQACDRRHRLQEARQWRKNIELVDAERKVHDARSRRDAMLRNASQRVAISNALSIWETNLLRQEVAALDMARRANHAAHVAMENTRAEKLARARENKKRRARLVADFTAQLRESVRMGNIRV